MSRFAVDTNILAYNVGVRRGDEDGPKVEKARAVLDTLVERAEVHVSNQALIELYNVLTRVALSRGEAYEQVEQVRLYAVPTVVDQAIIDDAFALARFNRFRIFDAVILSSAMAVKAAFLLSEDMQHGSTWSGTTIVNPFKPDYVERLAAGGFP